MSEVQKKVKDIVADLKIDLDALRKKRLELRINGQLYQGEQFTKCIKPIYLILITACVEYSYNK